MTRNPDRDLQRRLEILEMFGELDGSERYEVALEDRKRRRAEQQREWRRWAMRSPAYRARKNAKWREWSARPEVRARLRAYRRAFHIAHRDAILAVKRARYRSDHAQRARVKARRAIPEVRARINELRRRLYANPEWRLRRKAEVAANLERNRVRRRQLRQANLEAERAKARARYRRRRR